MQSMIQLLTSGWNLSRALFVVVGAVVIGEAIISRQLIGILPGIYFLASGLSGFGCSAGQCTIPPKK